MTAAVDLYKATKSPAIVTVPRMRFLMIDGTGTPGDERFRDAMSALYTLAYQVKFAAKKRVGLAYKVSPAEGLYWDAGGSMTDEPATTGRSAWRLMIQLPDEVDGDLVDDVRERAMAKKGLPLLAEVRVQTFSEGDSVQLLHVGPYADETPAVETLRAFASERGFTVRGPHHEIYLSDPNRTAPPKMKTILRYPVRRT